MVEVAAEVSVQQQERQWCDHSGAKTASSSYSYYYHHHHHHDYYYYYDFHATTTITATAIATATGGCYRYCCSYGCAGDQDPHLPVARIRTLHLSMSAAVQSSTALTICLLQPSSTSSLTVVFSARSNHGFLKPKPNSATPRPAFQRIWPQQLGHPAVQSCPSSSLFLTRPQGLEGAD